MTEYITKEATIQTFVYGDADVFENYGDDYYFGFSRESIKSAISAIPPVDVAPVVHGRWIHYNDGVFICSKCGNAESNDSYYCRYCGAKMDEGDNDAAD